MPQEKGNLMSSTINLVGKFHHELPNILSLTKLWNIKKISKLQGDTSYEPVSSRNWMFGNSCQKLHENRYQNFLVFLLRSL